MTGLVFCNRLGENCNFEKKGTLAKQTIYSDPLKKLEDKPFGWKLIDCWSKYLSAMVK